MHFWLVLRAGQDSVAVLMEAGLDRAAIDELIRTGEMRQAKSREERIMSAELVRYSVSDKIAEIMLDRPHEGVAADLHDDRRLGGEPARNLAGTVERGSLRDDLAEETHAKGGRGIKRLAQKQRPERLMFSNQSRQLHEVDRRD